jgi:hypothetical protein
MFFEVLGETFVLKKEKISGILRKKHNVHLHTIYRSPNIVRIVKSRQLRWTDGQGMLLIWKKSDTTQNYYFSGEAV